MPSPRPATKAIPGRTILIVDDEEDVRTALKALLEREGYTVTVAEGPTKALEIMRKEPIKLVISDQNMPDMSGIQFFRLIRERYPQVCRIMLTGDPERDTIIKAINEGEVYRFIPKPWNNTMLRVTVYFAFEAIQLDEENRRLVKALRRQLAFVRSLERDFPYLAAMAKQEEAELLLVQGVPPEEE
jgi:two-component system, probable response regulator PhcQ